MGIAASTLVVAAPAGLPVPGVGTASAAPGDGTVTVRVVQEVNANGLVDSTIMEPPLAGVTVHLTDDAGNSISAVTDDAGIATFTPASSALVGGQYRVEADNPRPNFFYPSHAANGQSAQAAAMTPADLQSPTNAKLSSTVEFVDVREAADAFVNMAFWYPAYYCQENPTLCSAVQPWSASPPGAASPPTERTLISVPYRFNTGDTPLATNADTGTVYGIAYDRDNQRIFSAAYAKRGSAYGPGGPGAIYVTDLAATEHPLTGATSVFATVPNPGTDNHDLGTYLDYAFYDHVGKESLGDIDITNDNRYLFGVNMFDKTVFVYDLADDSYLGSYEIPNPGCGDDWRPMGTGTGMDLNYVGGVCSGQTAQDMDIMTAHVYVFDPATGDFGAEVLSESLAYGRGRAYKGAARCTGAPAGTTTGRWFSWIDGYPSGPNEQNALGCDGGWMGYPTPMLGDIVEETNGDLVIALRDRFADQNGFNAYAPNANGTMVIQGQTGAGGDVVRGCKLTDGTFVLDPNLLPTDDLAPSALCTDNNKGSTNNGGQPRTYREFYIGDYRTGFHEEAFYGGIALARSEPSITGTGFDMTGGVWTQGIGAIDRGGFLPTGNLGVQTDDGTVDSFGKGAGMADLEVLCDRAPIQIGNRVWFDTDGDGVQDPGEVPVAGATVNLYDADGNLVGTTTTSANGTYAFDQTNVENIDGFIGLHESTGYTIRLDEPTDYDVGGPLYGAELTLPNVVAGGDELDSDGEEGVDGFPETTVTTGGAGQDDHTHDFGFVKPAVSVGDYVWVDLNGDGIQDDGEPGIPGVVLTLVDENGDPVTDVFGNLVGPVTTDANGFYEFGGLPTGAAYTVQIDQVASAEALRPYEPTLAEQGGDPAVDSSLWEATSVVLPNDGDRDPTLDFGFVPRAVSVGDFVWVDLNGDGIQDPGEPGIPGVVLYLTDSNGDPVLDVDGEPVDPVTTDANGFYEFTVLPAGEIYTVTIDQVASATALQPYLPTVANQGGDPAFDSSLWTATAGPLPNNGDRDPTLDFGFVYRSVSVGDFVWVDLDGDGIQDPGEPGIPGVVLNITDANGDSVYDVDGVLVESVTTDGNGYYVFPDLPSGAVYTVTIDQVASAAALAQYTPTVEGAGSDPARDSSTWTADSALLVENGASDMTLDFGFVYRSVSVGDYVWVDLNGDGIQDDGEPGIQDVVLQLTGPGGVAVTDVNGNPVGPVATDENGFYEFPNLPAGVIYTVTIDQVASAAALAPYTPTIEGAGSDPANDSSTWTATAGPLPNDGDRDPTLDFGFVPRAVSVGNLVWVDTNGNGVQDPGESGIPGVVLNITDSNGDPVTNVDGDPVGPVTTDASGAYLFPLLPAGEIYTVTIDQAASAAALDPYMPTIANQGGDPALDSSTWTATSGPLPNNGDSDLTLDFGFVPKSVSVGDYVWVDTDRDGVQDGGEPGIPGVVLRLTDANGDPVTNVNGEPVGPVTTDSNGFYLFPLLPAGTAYTVTIDQAASAAALFPYVPTVANQGGDPALDSSTWTVTSANLPNDGDSDMTLDFGFVPAQVSVGDYVWLDRDRDGIQDSGEPGIGGVLLTLTGPTGGPVTDVHGNPVGPVRTAADGSYRFDGLPVLPAGQRYTVTVSSPGSDPVRIQGTPADVPFSRIKPTTPGAGSNRAVDSSTGSARSTDLTTDGAHDPTLDFGFVLPSVDAGGRLWRDNDGDGSIDPGEPPIPGVLLRLTGPDGNPVTDVWGNPVAPVRTGPDGSYEFVDLPVLQPGQAYTVFIVQGDAQTAAALNGLELTTSSWQLPASGLTQDRASVGNLNFGFRPAAVPQPPATVPPTLPPTAPEPGQLPATGGDVWQTLQLVTLMLAAGLGLVVFARRRRRVG